MRPGPLPAGTPLGPPGDLPSAIPGRFPSAAPPDHGCHRPRHPGQAARQTNGHQAPARV